MFKYILLVFFICLGVHKTFAQTTMPTIPTLPSNVKKDFKSQMGNRWVLGGNFSVIFQPFLLDISPTLGYKLNQNFVAGIGLGGIYNRNKLKDSTLTKTVFTGRAYLQFRFAKILTGQAEYELMQSKVKNETSGISQSKLLHNPLLGGGLRIPILAGFALNITAMYNFNYQKEFSPSTQCGVLLLPHQSR